MTEVVDNIARRLAPLVQEGVIGGHTVREMCHGMTLVTVSPRPNSTLAITEVQRQVRLALNDLAGLNLEFLP